MGSLQCRRPRRPLVVALIYLGSKVTNLGHERLNVGLCHILGDPEYVLDRGGRELGGELSHKRTVRVFDRFAKCMVPLQVCIARPFQPGCRGRFCYRHLGLKGEIFMPLCAFLYLEYLVGSRV